MAARLADLQELHASLVTDRPRELGACVRWARKRFEAGAYARPLLSST